MNKNLTYVSRNFDKNLVKSSSTLKRYSLYANELDNLEEVTKKPGFIDENYSDSSSSLSLLADSSSSSPLSALSNPTVNHLSTPSRRECPGKESMLSNTMRNSNKNTNQMENFNKKGRFACI